MIRLIRRISSRGTIFKRIGLLGMVVSLLVVSLAHMPVAAATGAIDPNGDGTIGANWATTPAGTRYTTIDDAVRQPAVPTVSDYISIASNRADTAFFQMSSLASVSSVSSITVWVYHNDGNTGSVLAALYDNTETTMYGTEQTLTLRTADSWDSVTFSSLSLTQTTLDGLRIRFRAVKSSNGAASTVKIYAAYADATYVPAILSVDVVDGSGNSVASPSVGMSNVTAGFTCQSSTGSLGSASQKIRVSNTTANGNWTLTLAATGGATALWSNGTSNYDFNDSAGSPAGCSDGGDSDSRAGQLSVDASAATVTPQAACSSAGITKGGAMAFVEGTANNATLLTASGSQLSCYFDLTGVSLSQKVPAESPASLTPYTLNMTLTVTAN